MNKNPEQPTSFFKIEPNGHRVDLAKRAENVNQFADTVQPRETK